MARIRSPNYPSIGLPEAIEKLKLVHKAEQRLSAPRDVVARHMGYNGINGSSIKALSALLKYGLLEKTNDNKRRVAPLALKILHPRDPSERVHAIHEAAARPALFAEFAKKWPRGIPSDDNMKSYLIHRRFGVDAIPEVIKAYRETSKFVTDESGEYAPADGVLTGDQKPKQEHGVQTSLPGSSQPPPPPAPATQGSGGPVFRVSFTGGAIEVAGNLTSANLAEEFVQAINALKILLPRETATVTGKRQ